MYNNDLTLSQKRAAANRAFVEAALETYENNNKVEPKKYQTRFQEDANMVLEHTMRKQTNLARYSSFIESVKSSLVLECMYKMVEGALPKEDKTHTNTSILRAMCSQYIKENGCDSILFKMKTGSVALSEMHNLIESYAAAIVEAADKDDASTFVIAPEMKDEFFKALDYSDSEAIADAINARVSAATKDFVTANTKDHEDITAALTAAQEKIDKNPDADEVVKESYNYQAKRTISKIRNAPKNVLHCMVTTMCESVLKNQKEYYEFMNEGHVDIDKVVSRVTLMYTFMEMLNTSRLEKVDEAFIENVIKDLRA